MILHGENVILKADGVAIAAAKSCEVTINVDTDEIASSTDGKWKRYMVGRKSWHASASQLVTTVIGNTQMAGKSVALEMSVKADNAIPFKGFADNPALESDPLTDEPTFMTWDKTRKKFLAVIRTTRPAAAYYYDNYTFQGSTQYSSPDDYSMFYVESVGNFVYYNGDLHSEKLTGNALVTTWKGSFAKNSLAQGSFEFLGNGPLTPASLPTT